MTTVRRNRPGTKAKDFFKWPNQSFEEMESTLSYQQFIQQNIRYDPHNIELILNLPESLDFNKDSGIWKYEHVRQFCIELDSLFIHLQDICNPEECPQMSATSQCIYLCASHKTPQECPAIIYTRHTLDGSAALLNASKYFPSRVNFKESSLNKLESICRRIYRIFGHAYYHHRPIYDLFEAKTSLCQRFTLFALRFAMMAQDNIIVPIGSADCDGQDGPDNTFQDGDHHNSTCQTEVHNGYHHTSSDSVDEKQSSGTVKNGTADLGAAPDVTTSPACPVLMVNGTTAETPTTSPPPKHPSPNGGAIASLGQPSALPSKKGSSLGPTKFFTTPSSSSTSRTGTILPKRATTSLSPSSHTSKNLSSVAKTRHSDTSISSSLAQLS